MPPKIKQPLKLFISTVTVMIIPVHILGWFGIKALWLYGVGAVLGIIVGIAWLKLGARETNGSTHEKLD